MPMSWGAGDHTGYASVGLNAASTSARPASQLIVRDYAAENTTHARRQSTAARIEGVEDAAAQSPTIAGQVARPFKITDFAATGTSSPVKGFEDGGPGPLAISEPARPESVPESLPSDPVPAYEESTISPRPGYVSKSLAEVWDAAQNPGKPDRCMPDDCCKTNLKAVPQSPLRIVLKALALFIGLMCLNAALVLATVTLVQRIENGELDGLADHNDTGGLLNGIAGNLDEDESRQSAAYVKAAALAGFLTALPSAVAVMCSWHLWRRARRSNENASV